MKRVAALALVLASTGCGQGVAAPEPTPASDTLAKKAEDKPPTKPAPSPGADIAPAVACTAAEEPLFLCPVGRGRSVAVCSAPRADGGHDVHYRFGKGTSELTLPRPGGPPPRFGSVPYSGGGEQQIEFRNGDTRYIVFSRMVRTNFAEGEPNDPAIIDGLVVMQGEEVIAMHTCEGEPMLPVQYFPAEEAMGRVDHLFTEATAEGE